MYQITTFKSQNKERILECIYRNPSISRTEIAELTGITPATTTHTIAELIADSLVYEEHLPEVPLPSTAGRKRIPLNIYATSKYALGIEFNLKALTLCVTDLKGNIVYTEYTPYTDTMSTQITSFIIQKIRHTLDCCQIPESNFLGIGLAIPGHIDADKHFMVSNNITWKGFDAKTISSAFSIPLVLENNVRCMALSSYLFHPEYVPDSFSYFHVGMGMFCANILNGSLFQGHTYVSGEIGHTIVNPTGLRCECGKQGCLQTIASERWILKNVKQLYELDSFDILHRLVSSADEITLKTIAAAYSLGDETLISIVSNALKYLGISISNIAILMNPEKIFLHGELFTYPSIHSELMNLIHQQLTFIDNNYVQSIEILPYAKEDGAIGGAALAIMKFLLKNPL